MKQKRYTEKRPQIGDLVRIIQSETVQRVHNPGRTNKIGVVVEHIGIRCKVFYTDGRAGNPMREALEVL